MTDSKTKTDISKGDIPEIISALVTAMDAKDSYTAKHSKNVARYAEILAAANEMSDKQIERIFIAGLLHDIGKIGIPDSILKKKGELTCEEYEIIKDHVEGSVEIIKHLPSMEEIIPIVEGHHERWDGKGYPKGIAGEDIPLSARCLAIADAFDAMTTDRSYRKGVPIEYAAREIAKGAGSQFDPNLANLFVYLITEHKIGLLK